MYRRQQFYDHDTYYDPRQSGHFLNEGYPPHQPQMNQNYPPHQVQMNENFPVHQAQMNENIYPYQQSSQPGTPFEYFSKPEQPNQWPVGMGQEYSNFYPPPNPQNNQGQSPSVLAQFQDENGKVSFDKVITTVNHLASTFQQVTPVVQQVSAMIKTFR